MLRRTFLVLGCVPTLAFGQFLDLPRRDYGSPRKILISTFYSAHRDAISSESWASYNIVGGYSVGLAYQWGPRKFRPVSTVKLVDDAAWHPGLTWRSGFRSFATGEIRESMAVNQTFGATTLFVGISTNSGFGNARAVGGGSYDFQNGAIVGFQADGRRVMTFVNYSKDGPVLGAYLVDWKHPAYLLGWRF